MSQVHAINVKVSTSSPDGSCQLVPLRTKCEVEANNGMGANHKIPGKRRCRTFSNLGSGRVHSRDSHEIDKCNT